MNYAAFSTAVRRRRIKQGLSQVGLAREAGLARATIVDLENGAVPIGLRLSTLVKISEALCVSPDVLFFELIRQDKTAA